MFAIRNHVVEAVDKFNVYRPKPTQQSVEASLRILNRLIEKMPTDDQATTIAIFDVALKLDSFAAVFGYANELYFEEMAKPKAEELLGALSQFDILSSDSLSIVEVSEEVDGAGQVKHNWRESTLGD
jgi:hypothetical protein